MQTPDRPERRYDLDWLRVGAFLLLIYYHAGLLFIPWWWHIKNPETTSGVLEVALFFSTQWRLSILFVISGAVIRFSLRRRSAGQFVRERFTRLLLPLAFGMLVIVPPQVYFERRTQGVSYASFLDFLSEAYKGVYPHGNLAWHHLWFIAYVFVFALLALPLFLYLRGERGQRLVGRLAPLLARPGALLAMGLPLVLSEVLLRPSWPSRLSLVSDWANFVSYLIVFVYGYVLYSDDRFGQAIERSRRLFLFLGVAAFAVIVLVWKTGYAPEVFRDTPQSTSAVLNYSLANLAWVAGKACNTWFWVLTLIGFSRRYLNIKSRAIAVANEAVYPVYILHQTVLLAFAYYLLDWHAGIPVKFLVISNGTLLGTVLLYLLARTNPVTRVLLGMKASDKAENAARAPRHSEERQSQREGALATG